MPGTQDAILIPGGGLLPGGAVPPWVAARLDRAIALRRDAFLIPLSAGTPHRARRRLEAVQGARYLLRRGVPAEKILVEAVSYDTIGNAWFSRLLHAEPRGLRRLLIITSAFHIARAEAAFRWVYGLTPRPVPFRLAFESVPDTGMEEAARRARCRREQESLDSLLPLTTRHRDVASFHRWLYSEHTAYAAAALTALRPRLAGPVLDTY